MVPKFMPISFFKRVALVFKVFQDIWHSNKENPGMSWSATLSCPSKASNDVNLYLVSDLVLDVHHSLDFLEPISFYRRVSRFVVYQTGHMM